LRFLFIVNSNGLSDKLGGSISRTINLAREIERKGHKIYFLTTSGGFSACKKAGLTGNFYVLPSSFGREYEISLFDRALSYVISTIACIPKISQLPEVDVIYTDSDYFCDTIPALLYKKRTKISKWLASFYHFIPPPSKRPGGITLLNILSHVTQQFSLRLIGLNAELVATETIFTKSELSETRYLTNTKIVAIQSGINPKFIDAIDWTKGKKYDACYLGGLRRTKGILDLIKAWPNVCKHIKTAKLAIAGNIASVSLTEVHSELQKLGIETNVDVLGFLSEEEKYKLLKASRLYVLPSFEEGIPITFYEAMYCELPIITYFLPPYQEITEFITTVPLGNTEMLSEAIIQLLDDDILSKKYRVKGKLFSKMHTWDDVADYLLNQLTIPNNTQTG
jgi:glycosyltransferase involved in cell wall biosynthesis